MKEIKKDIFKFFFISVEFFIGNVFIGKLVFFVCFSSLNMYYMILRIMIWFVIEGRDKG